VNRAISTTIIFALLGGLTAVAVGWGAVVAAWRWQAWSLGERELSMASIEPWLRRWTGTFPDRELYEDNYMWSFGPAWVTTRHFMKQGPPPPPQETFWFADYRPCTYIEHTLAGWPCKALIGSTGDGAGISEVRDAITLEWPRSVQDCMWPAVLPLRPLWPGFLINTAFYGGVLWLLWCGQGTIRRERRRRRGLCEECGYDRRGDVGSVCPECGKP
jgi:hypothetical protein